MILTSGEKRDVWMRALWVKKRNTRKEQMFSSSGHSSRCLEGVPLQFQRAKPKRRVLTMPACIRVSATGCVDPGVNGSSPSARRGRLSHVEPELVDGRDAGVPPDLGNRLGRALGKRLQRAGRCPGESLDDRGVKDSLPSAVALDLVSEGGKLIRQLRAGQALEIDKPVARNGRYPTAMLLREGVQALKASLPLLERVFLSTAAGTYFDVAAFVWFRGAMRFSRSSGDIGRLPPSSG